MLDDDTLAALARALGHPARVRIVRLLAEQTECMGAEVFSRLPLAQSTVSEHLRVLREAGVVSSRTLGPRTVYCLVPAVLQALRDAVAAIAEDLSSCSTEGCR